MSLNGIKEYFHGNEKLKFLIVYLILRIPLIIIKCDTSEFVAAEIMVEALQNGGLNPFESHKLFYTGQQYFPVFYYFAFLILLLGGNYLIMKLLWIVFDFLCVVYIYKIGDISFKFNKNKRNLLVYLYLLCPFIFIFTGLRGLGEVVVLFFILSAHYYFINKKFVLSFILLSIGTLYGFFPIILVIPYFLYIINYKETMLKTIIKFLVIFMIIFILTTLPFFFLYGLEYLNDLFSIVFRSDYSIGTNLVMSDIDLTSIMIFDYKMTITFYNIIQVIIAAVTFSLFFFKYKVDNYEKLTIVICIFFLLVPIISRSFHFRMLFWVLPFLFLQIINQQSLEVNPDKFKSIERNFNIQLFIFTIGNIILLFSFLVFSNINPNFSIDRQIFYAMLLVFCLVWCFFLFFLNLIRLLISEILIIYYCLYLYFFIFYGYTGEYILFFFPIYCVIYLLFIFYFLKGWNFRNKHKL